MSDKIYLSREEQIFLMEMTELETTEDAVDKFVTLMILEKADPIDLKKYLKKIMGKMK